MKRATSGFTIVELLIVIIVVAILAAITIVAYNGIQSRAHDSAVQNDLKNIAKQLEFYQIDNGMYPVGSVQLSTLVFGVSKNSYGNGIVSNRHNLLYCRAAAEGPTKIAIIAGSKSGSVFTYKSETGVITKASSWISADSSNVNCQDAGISQADALDRDFFFYNDAWLSYAT